MNYMECLCTPICMLNHLIVAFMAKNSFLDDKPNWINHALISMPAKSIGSICYISKLGFPTQERLATLSNSSNSNNQFLPFIDVSRQYDQGTNC